MAVKTRQSISDRMRNIKNSETKNVNIASGVKLDTNIASSGVTLSTSIDQTNVIVPTDDQNGLSRTIQTHTSSVVTPNGGSASGSYIDCDGWDNVVVHLNASLSAAGDNEIRLLWSNDGLSMTTYQVVQFEDVVTHDKKVSKDYKIKMRFLSVQLRNLNASSANTMSAWTYFKM
jgi:hypothetical protein